MAHGWHIAEQHAAASERHQPRVEVPGSSWIADNYDLYHASLFAYCLSLLSSRQAAEDVVQESFARFSAAPPEHVQNPKAWLFAVARNLCADIGRRRGRFPTDDAAATETFENLSVGIDSSDEAMSREDAEQLLLALRQLNPRYRTALILREVHGLPVSEIAEALETTEGATHTLLSRSRDALGKAISEVSEAPQACRRALVLAFKRTGTGISAAEQRSLDVHLSDCPTCRRRVRQAERATPLAALLPLLTASDAQPAGLIARAMASLGDYSLIPALSSCAQPTAKTIGTMMLAAALLAPATSAVRQEAVPDPLRAAAVTVATPKSAFDGDSSGDLVRTRQRPDASTRVNDGTPMQKTARLGDLDGSSKAGQSDAEGSAQKGAAGQSPSAGSGEPRRQASDSTEGKSTADQQMTRAGSTQQQPVSDAGPVTSLDGPGGADAGSVESSGSQGTSASGQLGPAGEGGSGAGGSGSDSGSGSGSGGTSGGRG